MGALISFYTGLEYDEVFSKIGVFSLFSFGLATRLMRLQTNLRRISR